jgi:hypothetical protein
MKRQRGRNRKPGGGGGGGGGNNPNRAFESNGPEGMKIRGNAQHVYERYQQLARDAFTSGDRVLAENHLQHAEHYFRVLRTIQPQRPVAEIAARDAFASGFDIDFEDETAAEQQAEADANAEAAEAEGGERQNGERQNGRDDYRRDEYRNENRENREPREQREPREFGEQRRDFGGQPREGEGREGGRREGRRERFERRRAEGRERGQERDQNQASNADPLAVVEPRGSELPAPEPQARDMEDEGGHLPAFLRQPSAPGAGDEGGDRPRRGPRRRRPSDDENGASSIEAAEEDA